MYSRKQILEELSTPKGILQGSLNEAPKRENGKMLQFTEYRVSTVENGAPFLTTTNDTGRFNPNISDMLGGVLVPSLPQWTPAPSSNKSIIREVPKQTINVASDYRLEVEDENENGQPKMAEVKISDPTCEKTIEVSQNFCTLCKILQVCMISK